MPNEVLAGSCRLAGRSQAEGLRGTFFSEVLPTPDFKGSKQSHCHCYWRSLIPGDQESVRVHARVCVFVLTADVKGAV